MQFQKKEDKRVKATIPAWKINWEKKGVHIGSVSKLGKLAKYLTDNPKQLADMDRRHRRQTFDFIYYTEVHALNLFQQQLNVLAPSPIGMHHVCFLDKIGFNI